MDRPIGTTVAPQYSVVRKNQGFAAHNVQSTQGETVPRTSYIYHKNPGFSVLHD